MSTTDMLKLWIVLAGLGLAPGIAAVEAAAAPATRLAAEAPAATDDPQGAAETADAAPAATGERGGNGSAAADAAADGEPSDDVFVPTEEISEDYAVSFPVDI